MARLSQRRPAGLTPSTVAAVRVLLEVATGSYDSELDRAYVMVLRYVPGRLLSLFLSLKIFVFFSLDLRERIIQSHHRHAPEYIPRGDKIPPHSTMDCQIINSNHRKNDPP